MYIRCMYMYIYIYVCDTYTYVYIYILFEDILYPNKMLDHTIFSAMRQLRGYRHLIRRGWHAADASVFGATNDVKQEKL